MAKSLDIILNAINRTEEGTAAAAANVQGYADTVVAANSQATQSFQSVGTSGVDSVISAFGSVAAAVTPVVIGLGVVAGAAALVYANWQTIASVVGAAGQAIVTSGIDIANNIGTALVSMANGTFNWRNAFRDAAEVVVTAFAVAEGVILNFSTAAAFVGLSATLAFVTFANQIQHIFTVTIPAYLTWFGDNWGAMFVDLATFTGTVVSNMYENLVRFFTAVFEMLQGNGFNFEWVSLTEGFEATMQELPVIAAREIGALEKQLGRDVGILGQTLADGIQDNVNKRLGQFQGLFGGKGGLGLFDAISAKFSGIGGLAGGLFGGLGGKGAGGQIQQADGESSRFLTGASAAGTEALAREQVELQRQQLAVQNEQKNLAAALKALAEGNIQGYLRKMAEKAATGLIVG
jgi:uncharacterized protein CbrC (UPF0167 family)